MIKKLLAITSLTFTVMTVSSTASAVTCAAFSGRNFDGNRVAMDKNQRGEVTALIIGRPSNGEVRIESVNIRNGANCNVFYHDSSNDPNPEKIPEGTNLSRTFRKFGTIDPPFLMCKCGN